MKLLLDTHVLLWSLLEPQRLPGHLVAELTSANNELWISPISVWEIALLAEKGRIQIDAPSHQEWIRDMLARVPLKQAPLNYEVALQSRSIDLEHQDPADRFIAATALGYDLDLVTADQRLLALQQVRTIPC